MIYYTSLTIMFSLTMICFLSCGGDGEINESENSLDSTALTTITYNDNRDIQPTGQNITPYSNENDEIAIDIVNNSIVNESIPNECLSFFESQLGRENFDRIVKNYLEVRDNFTQLA